MPPESVETGILRRAPTGAQCIEINSTRTLRLSITCWMRFDLGEIEQPSHECRETARVAMDHVVASTTESGRRTRRRFFDALAGVGGAEDSFAGVGESEDSIETAGSGVTSVSRATLRFCTRSRCAGSDGRLAAKTVNLGDNGATRGNRAHRYHAIWAQPHTSQPIHPNVTNVDSSPRTVRLGIANPSATRPR